MEHLSTQDQDQDSFLVKRRNDNQSSGPVIRELVPSSHQRSELSNTILLEELSDQCLHCLPFRLHLLDALLYGRATFFQI